MKHKHGCADLQLCLQRDAERVQIVGNTQKCHKMNKQTSILGGFFSATDQPTKSAREQGMESNEKLQWED